MSRLRALTDAQWSLIAAMVPGPTGRPGRKFSDPRTMIEGIVYRYRTGVAWRDLPEAFGPWQTVWTWHRRMAAEGTWDAVLAKLTSAADAAGVLNWSLSVDSTIARAHQHGTNTTRPAKVEGSYGDSTQEPSDHAVGRSRGGLSTKIHQLVDGNGLPLVTLVSAGQAGDSPLFMPLMAHLQVARAVGRPRTRPDAVRGDKAYSSRAIRGYLRSRGIKAVIPEPSDQQEHRKRRGSRGGRPVALDKADYRQRNVIERRYAHIKQWRGLATRYDNLAVVFRAAVVLNSVIAWTRQLSDTS